MPRKRRIDLWENYRPAQLKEDSEEFVLKSPTLGKSRRERADNHVVSAPSSMVSTESSRVLQIRDDRTFVASFAEGEVRADDLEDFSQCSIAESNERTVVEGDCTSSNVMTLLSLSSAGMDFHDADSEKRFGYLVARLKRPVVEVVNGSKNIDVHTHGMRLYSRLMGKLGAYPKGNGVFRFPVSRAFELELITRADKRFPLLEFSPEAQTILRSPIPGFDGTVESLRSIPLSALYTVNANTQTWKQLKKSSKSLEEKLSSFGLESVYDALTFLPRRYIDKTNPQSLEGLLKGETATVTGAITSVVSLPNGKGVKFNVKPKTGKSVPVAFWRQDWLKTKFSKNDEVIITGKVSIFRGQRQLNGASIDHADEVAALPIVPIYSQSETRGITTRLILSIVREIVSRLGDFSFPKYLPVSEQYSDVLREIHFPSSLEKRNDAFEVLAERELILMQLLLLHDEREKSRDAGLAFADPQTSMSEEAVKKHPFSLTEDQKTAVLSVKKSMSGSSPSYTLLNADVGAGKTLVAQILSLHAVDHGYQAVFAAPTDVLAQQVYANFCTTVERLDNAPRVRLFTGSMSGAEKTEIKKELRAGAIDILIGTHSVLTKSVTFKNLGFAVVDEQQKFGTDQRTQILHSRKDGKIPHLLMMSATPIPRSVAQAFYGGVSMLELKGKPPGRKEIVTTWYEEDPDDVVKTALHPLWMDVQKELDAGNQAFVVTPLVESSAKVDASSVEDAFKDMQSLFGKDNVGVAHGGMKHAEVSETMRKFRAKEFSVLVASSIVEVGVDIPDATYVVVLSAERFGAASLHQIRGRVGRSEKQSTCALVSLGKTDSAQDRLQAMVDFSDGFSIAKADLALRGEGAAFGSQQHGANEMIFANIGKHEEKIPEARKSAEKILNSEYASEALEDALRNFDTFERLI